MNKFILILGGARSGKSRYAVKLAKSLSKKVLFLATAISLDKEMTKRIKLHKASRPQCWKTIEESKDISSILNKLKAGHFDVALIDCLGLLVSNLLLDKLSDSKIKKILTSLCEMLSKSKSKFSIILVSNEVGEGIVPTNPLARRFRDIVGSVNQMIAEEADEVIFMQAGIPVKIKNALRNCGAISRT